MIKSKYRYLLFVIGICFMQLTGCERNSASTPPKNVAISDTDSVERDMTEVKTDITVVSEESQSQVDVEAESAVEELEDASEGLKNEADDTPQEVPQLPDTGKQLEDFVPEGWEIKDSAELDFNEDGIPDYVAVLEAALIDGMYQDYPRILFAIASDETAGYRLDFQDINLIGKGSLYGEGNNGPLIAEGTSFTTHTSGGKGWPWSQDYTYTYRGGIWWLILSEEISGYGEYVGEYTTSYSKNDWDSGVGIRKKRSTDWDDIEENWGSEEYDAVYEIVLDEPLTLEQAGKRSHLAPDRVTDWSVEAIVFAMDAEFSEDMVKLPNEAYIRYCDENGVLYTSKPGLDNNGYDYLALYCWQDKVLHVLTKEETEIANPEIYKGKIYYSTEIVENIAYKTIWNEKEQVIEKEDTVGIRLYRMELDGTEKETIFEYRYPGTEQEIMESKIQIPSMGLSYEISGDEIIAEIQLGDEPHPIYRMKTDGSECKKIGQLPKE